jgi:hypothetical protein
VGQASAYGISYKLRWDKFLKGRRPIPAVLFSKRATVVGRAFAAYKAVSYDRLCERACAWAAATRLRHPLTACAGAPFRNIAKEFRELFF